MSNPSINPPWAVDQIYTVSNSEYLAVDVRLSELDEESVELELTVPGGATVHAIRDPAVWTDVGSELLGVGGWVASPVLLGNWTVSVTPGAAVTDPAHVEINNGDGLSPAGLLRLVFKSLGGSACVVEPSGGNLSIDRLLADPSIINAQVATGIPVYELDTVQLTATAQATQEVNPAPSVPLPALPAVLSEWEPDAANPAAVTGFISSGTTADFQAPAAYATLHMNFMLKTAYDMDASGTMDPGEPSNEYTLGFDVETVTHGMLLVLDRSGSMGSTLGGVITKWDATVQAAHAWLDLFRSFRSGSNHQAGIITFEHDTCGWTKAVYPDVTVRNPQTGAAVSDASTDPMSDLPSFGDFAVLNLGTDQSCTPIGDALVYGLQTLQKEMSVGDLASIILLTDGYENSGEITIASSTTGTGAADTFGNKRTSPGLSYGNDLVGDRLFTIAVGESVDADRLNDLPNPPGAQMGAGYYRMTTDVAEILPTFADMLGLVLDAQRVSPSGSVVDPSPPSHAMYFVIPTGEQRIAMLVPWPSSTHNLHVAWREQGDTGSFTVLNAGDPGVIGYWRRQFHGIMTVDLTVLTGSGSPPATEWRIQHLDNSDVAQPLTDADVLCMIDLVTKADISFDQPQYFLGDPIQLRCAIRSGGRRVTGASVGVDVAKPGEGLGTFLTTNANLYLKDRQTKPTGPDPDQGKGLMFKSILERMDMHSLPIVTPPAFSMLDDGAHGDGAPDNGDYGYGFTDTDKEGTYTFRFRIEGTLEDGSRFSRLFVRSTWVGVKPDPEATDMQWTTLEDVPAGMIGSLLTFIPKTLSNEYLGPYRLADIAISVLDGVLDGPLTDNLNGSYSQRVIYSRTQDPVVSIDVYGKPMKPTGPTLGIDQDQNCFRLLLRALICLLRKLLRLLGLRL